MSEASRWIIGCRKGARPSEDELMRHGFAIVGQHEHADGLCILVESSGVPLAGVLEALRSHPGVAYVEPDHPLSARNMAEPLGE
jgi:hypothetical protein